MECNALDEQQNKKKVMAVRDSMDVLQREVENFSDFLAISTMTECTEFANPIAAASLVFPDKPLTARRCV